MPLTVLGISPGFAACGWAVLRWDDSTRPTLVDADTIRTRARDDLWQRTEQIRLGLMHAMGIQYRAAVVCVEAYSAVRDPAIAHQLGRTWGVLEATAAQYALPVIHVTPQQVREKLLGRRTGSKADVHFATVDRLLPDPRDCLAHPLSEHESCAIAVVLACEGDPLIVGLRKRDMANES